VSVSYPVMPTTADAVLSPSIRIDGGQDLPTAPVTSIDAMARRALADEMPGITLRAVVRATVRATAQYQAQRAAEQRRRKGDDNAAAALDAAAIALAIAGAVTESADERTWRSLPGTIHLARTTIPLGRHTLEVDTPQGVQRFDAEITEPHTVVALRLVQGRLFMQLPQAPSAPGTRAAAPVNWALRLSPPSGEVSASTPTVVRTAAGVPIPHKELIP